MSFKVSDLAQHVKVLCDELESCMSQSPSASGEVSMDTATICKAAADILVMCSKDAPEAGDADPEDPSGEPKNPTRGKQERAVGDSAGLTTMLEFPALIGTIAKVIPGISKSQKIALDAAFQHLEKGQDAKPGRKLAIDWTDPRMQNASESSPLFDHGPRRAPAPLLGDIFGGESTTDDAPTIENIFGSEG